MFIYLDISVILEKLLTQENRVLEYWTSKKKRLDQNQQYVLFERSARQALAWIKEEGDIYLSTHTQVQEAYCLQIIFMASSSPATLSALLSYSSIL